MNLLDGELNAVEGRLSFGNRDTSLVTGRRPDWHAFTGRTLTLGIRPEDVRLAERPGEDRLGMEVRLVERLGAVQLATLAAARWTVTARLPVTPAIREGATVFAAFDLTRATLFDPATGRALCHGHLERMKDEG